MEALQQSTPHRRLEPFADVCAFLHISKPTGHRWRNDPAMNFPQAIRLGPRAVRFDMDEVVAWVASRKGISTK